MLMFEFDGELYRRISTIPEQALGSNQISVIKAHLHSRSSILSVELATRSKFAAYLMERDREWQYAQNMSQRRQQKNT